jgi:hypothetical protein
MVCVRSSLTCKIKFACLCPCWPKGEVFGKHLVSRSNTSSHLRDEWVYCKPSVNTLLSLMVEKIDSRCVPQDGHVVAI